VLDRLLHHCTIINIRGKSYRLREKQKTGLIGIQTKIEENEKLRKTDR
ncbi:MAG: AAA family ATPase, partial [Thermotogae bacterium]|nr:AAA family ATPase [Thermotogota bacterium]